MPTLTKDHTLAASNTDEIVYLPLDYHVLKTATCFDLTASGTSNDNWIQLVILAGGLTQQNVVVSLATGPSGNINPIFWTGSIPVEADHYLAAIIRGRAGDQFRLSAILWKIRLDDLGEFRADP